MQIRRFSLALAASVFALVSLADAQTTEPLKYVTSPPGGSCAFTVVPQFVYSGVDAGTYWACRGTFSGNPSNWLNGTWMQVTPPTTVVAGDGKGGFTTATAAQVSALNTSVPTGTVSQGICHATYNFAVDGGGAPGLITPAANCVIPANSIITNELIDWTTAGTGATNTTSIGTTGTGGGAAILLGATAVASLTGIVQGVIVPQTASGFKKITTAGAVTLTTAVAALTAGVAEIYVYYLTPAE